MAAKGAGKTGARGVGQATTIRAPAGGSCLQPLTPTGISVMPTHANTAASETITSGARDGETRASGKGLSIVR